MREKKFPKELTWTLRKESPVEMFPSQPSVDRPHIAPAEYIHGRLDPFCNENIGNFHCDVLCIVGN